MARCYGVTSREWEMYSQSEVDPAEYGCSFVYVFTTTKRRARILAVRYWRHVRSRKHKLRNGLASYRDGSQYHPHLLHDFLEDDGHPFQGMKVEDLGKWDGPSLVEEELAA